MNKPASNERRLTTSDVMQRGFKALSSGRIEEASACCKAVLARHPDLVQAHFLVGLIALASQDRKTATSAFITCTKIEPAHAAAWAHLAKLLAEGGQVNRADIALSNAVKYENGDIPQIHDIIGASHSMLGEYEAANIWYQKAAQAVPDNPAFNVNYANNLVYLGESKAAEKQLEHVLDIAPKNPQAHWILSGLRKATDHSHIEKMKAILGTEKIAPQGQAFLNYGTGKELEDLKEWDSAFECFLQGGKARRKVVAHNENNDIETFEALDRIYNKDWLEQQAEGHDTQAPIFIVGQPRTGTTLVERILTAHSDVHSAGELQQFGNSVRRLSQYDHSERLSAALFEGASTLNPEILGKEYMARTTKLRGSSPRFVDKLPYNYLFLPHILTALPNAKIIHLVRDPRDVCFSVFKQLFADAYTHSYDLGEMARHFVRYYRLMETWRERFPGRFLDVKYEDVAGDVDSQARRMIDYLELPWQDACVNFHQQDSAVTTASAVQVRQPAHTRSIGRWRQYEEQLQPVLDILRQENIIEN
ncbi:MAG: sulfotransferase [Pseudomonadales bacterium]